MTEWEYLTDEDELHGDIVDWRPSPGELDDIYGSLDAVLDYMKRHRVGR